MKWSDWSRNYRGDFTNRKPTTDGTFPDGYFDNPAVMEIEFCCRGDGFVDTGIHLPIGKIKEIRFFSFLYYFTVVSVTHTSKH